MQREVTVKFSNSTEETSIAHLVQLANQFKSSIYFEMGNARVNAKSIMGMYTLILAPGTNVTIDAEGEDELNAVEKITDFLTH